MTMNVTSSAGHHVIHGNTDLRSIHWDGLCRSLVICATSLLSLQVRGRGRRLYRWSVRSAGDI